MATTAIPNVSTAADEPPVAETLAPIVRALLGDPPPVRMEFWDGSALGQSDERRHVAAAITGRLPATAVESQPARPGPGLHHRRARRRWRHLRALGGAAGRLAGGSPVGDRAGAGGDQGRPSPRRARPAAAAAGAGGQAPRRSPLGPPRRRRDPSPLRRRQRLLPPRARAGDDVLVRPLRRRHHRPDDGAGVQARPHLPQARARHDGGRAPPRCRVWLGLDGHPRRQPLRRRRGRHHDQRGAGGAGPRARRRGRGRRPGRDPPPGLPRHRRPGVRRDLIDRDVRARRPPATSTATTGCCAAPCGRPVGCSTTPSARSAGRSSASRRSSAATCSPTAS